MSQDRPSPPDRKLALVTPLLVVGFVGAILGGTVVLALRKPPPPAVAPPPSVAAPPSPVLVPVAPPVLDRAELIERAAVVASAYAPGVAPPADRDPLQRRAFRIVIPFGCDGPQTGADTAQAFYKVDAVRKTITLVARPADWTGLPQAEAPSAADKIESVEGFWIPQPWTAAEHCPVRGDGSNPAGATAPPAQTLGLARLFDQGGSRVFRRGGRPYEFVRKMSETDVAPLSHTYRLVLEGRVATFPDGQALVCWSGSPESRPTCLMAVEYDRVAFEDGQSGEVLAEWRE